MNAKATPAQKFQIIPVKQLQVAPDNIRKTPATKAEDAQLRASIRNNGVIMPLIVKASAKGQYLVYAGGRRLEHTRTLIKEKVFPATHSLACLIAPPTANETEISIIENTLQAKMHPVDQFEAFHKLHHGDKLSVNEISLHFGLGKKHIEQLLALGGVHPELRELCRAGKLKVESLQAYAVTDNQERQLEVYEALRKQGPAWADSEHNIRKLLTENTFNTDHKFVKFIGLKEYRARGGEATPDLFQGKTILHNADLVQTLLREKLDETTTAVQAEGWKWVETDLDYHNKYQPFGHQKPTIELTQALKKDRTKLEKQLTALQSELAKLEEKAETEDSNEIFDRINAIEEEIPNVEEKIAAVDRAAATFTDRQKSAGGSIITLTFEGKLDIIRGLTRKEEKPGKKAKRAASHDEDNDGEELEDDDAEADDGESQSTVDESQLYSQAVYDDLACYHLAAARTELLYNHELMYQLAQFALCWQMLGDASYPYALNLSLRRSEKIESSKGDIESGRVHQELLEFRDKLNLTWILDTEVESFRAFQALDQKDVVKLVGYCMTLSLQKITLNPKFASETLLDELLTQANAKLDKHWQPGAGNFFSRIGNDQRLAIAHELYQPSEPPPAVKKMKKGEFSTWLQDRVLEFPIGKRWLPPGFTYLKPSESDALYKALKDEAGQ